MTDIVKVKQVLKSFVNECMEADSRSTGHISFRSFDDICDSFGINGGSADILDQMGNDENVVHYFSFISNVCDFMERRNEKESRIRDENIDHNTKRRSSKDRDIEYQRENSTRQTIGKSPFSCDDDQNYLHQSKRRSSGQANGQYPFPRDDDNYDYSKQTTKLSTKLSGHTPFPRDDDNFDYSKQETKQSIHRSSRSPFSRDFDGEEFEESKHSSNLQRNDEQTFTSSELISKINDIISNRVGSTNLAFKKWKGINGKLSAKNLQEGLFQDGQLDISVQELQKIIPTEIGLTEFAKLVSSNNDISKSRKVGTDDETICEIARQISEPGWENIILKVPGSNEMGKNLQRIGIYVDSSKLSYITSKLGKTGLINAIKIKLGQ